LGVQGYPFHVEGQEVVSNEGRRDAPKYLFQEISHSGGSDRDFLFNIFLSDGFNANQDGKSGSIGHHNRIPRG
jgi:hypothetical protein